MPSLRIVFAGTPQVAVPALEVLESSTHDVVSVITRKEAPIGRKRVLTPSPISVAATNLDIPVLETNHLNDFVTESVATMQPDLGVIVAYGGLVREPLLSTPRLGWINVHFSLLPAWRGAAPVQHALIAGDSSIGVSVFSLVPELDAGDVYASTVAEVNEDATAGDVLANLSGIGASLLLDVVDNLADGSATATAQRGAVTLAPKLTIDDGRLEWHQSAESIFSRFRGVTPEPGAWTTLNDGSESRLKILELNKAVSEDRVHPGEVQEQLGGFLVGTATTPLFIARVQPAGKVAMAAADWLRGIRAGGVSLK